MRCIKAMITASLLLPLLGFAQSKASLEQYHIMGNNRTYVPMSIAHFQNNKKWYAEGRYNYEELETFSLYVGKTFSKKEKLSYVLTPLLGGAIGNFNGVSTGINMDLDYSNFFFSLQSQYSFSTDRRADNFFYNWSELAYQPLAWLYGGISVQHTRLYRTETRFEPGLLIGFSYRNLTLPVYTFAPFNRNRYFMVGLNIEWEKTPEKRTRKNTIAELTAD
ncbi:MAG: hypothetical protein H7122_14895 [Chitinophagaceae bacterium]|nr:hypothetical protein [Chitinophagaceae bacterium]